MSKGTPMDLTGQKYGRLLVVGYSHKEGNCNYYDCICDCSKGQEKRKVIKVKGKYLRDGSTQSCGCLRREINKKAQYKSNTTHLSKSIISQLPYYKEIRNRWSAMKYHYINPKSKNYQYFGAKGLKVYPLWIDKNMGFIMFYSWAISNGFTESCKIERKDKNGNYEPDNCHITFPEMKKSKKTEEKKKVTKSKKETKAAKSKQPVKNYEQKENKEQYQQVNFVKNDILLLTADNTQISLIRLLKEFGVDLKKIEEKQEPEQQGILNQKPDSLLRRFKKVVGF